MVNGYLLSGLLALLAVSALPHELIGEWRVGRPYDLGVHHPVGLDDKQGKKIIGLVVSMSRGRINVCGKNVQIRSVAVTNATAKDFLAEYGFTADRIGLSGDKIEEVTINGSNNSKACGDFSDPGTHVFFDADHAVLEVANAYFRLSRRP